MRKRMLIVVLGAVGLGVVGCISPPNKVAQQASQAQEDAKTVGAVRYAPDQAKAAMAAYDAAQAEMAVQAKKFVLFRNYTAATNQLTEAVTELTKARTEALKTKAGLKGPVREAMKTANDAVDAADQMMAKATASKARVDLVAWQNNLAALRQLLADATAAQNGDDLILAKAKLDSAVTEAGALQATMNDALAGKSTPKPGKS
ncbi:MAG: hypothetical protein U0167_11785 [bacterium]